MFKSEKSGLATLAEQTKLKFKIKAGLDEAQGKGVKVQNPNLPAPPKDEDTFVKIDTSTDAAPIMRRGEEEDDYIPHTPRRASVQQQQEEEEEEMVPIKMKPMEKKVKVKPKPNKKDKKNKKDKNKKNKRNKKGGDDEDEAAEAEEAEEAEVEEPKKKKKETKKDKEKNLQARMAELYGDEEGKVYPEPMLAGKIPGNIAHDRELMRRASLEQFKFSIRFRTGPIGVTFNNMIQDGSFVESVAPGSQAMTSDIQKGDRIIAINDINITTASAKNTMRVLQSQQWPIVLVFMTPEPTGMLCAHATTRSVRAVI
jgi:hypothetical protein